jgi:hypothetical protein
MQMCVAVRSVRRFQKLQGPKQAKSTTAMARAALVAWMRVSLKRGDMKEPLEVVIK